MSPRSKSAGPTLKHVAERAGVSQATASKVLNGRADVAPGTRERVLQVLDEAGYRARSSSPAETGRKRVAAIFDGITSQYAALILDGMVSAAADLGVDVSVLRTPKDFADPARKAARSWVHENQAFTGVIAVTSSLPADMIRTAAQVNLPLITIDPADESQSDLVSISSTDWTGGRSMTEHLLELGHTRIAWIGGPAVSAPTIERFHGYRSSLERAGIPVDPAICRNGPYSFEAGIEAGRELMRGSDRPTAIICASDAIAFGVLEAARRERLEVPRDLSVGGFDDIPQAEWVSPKLTSVRAPLIGIGRMAIETILGMSVGKEPPSHHIQLATQLIVRESTAPPVGAVVPADVERAVAVP
ncbi:LacI family DNA-binding transcriptional regulator [Planctomonas psychrotolerans]|uniref:LacI family DNA-binding transcriptional regulator n=1 Tax=Planctomonas psychrotolerans TaxID=2528712 RepID=UPI001239ECC4|nr:LacI family DNA-binding transcriptional regulator [Planctomonas psychrotolerans]